MYIHGESKKPHYTRLLFVASPNVDRFLKNSFTARFISKSATVFVKYAAMP